MSATKDYAVTIKIRNNWMLKAMEAAGIESAPDLARKSGVSYQRVLACLKLECSFIDHDGSWKPFADKLAFTLGCLPEEIVPPQHLRHALAKSSGTFEADIEEVQAVLEFRTAHDPLALVEDKERAAAISEAMRLRLSDRERHVVDRRYGLNGEDEQSLEQIAADLGLGRERVRQLEKRALRKLRLGGMHRTTYVVDEHQAAGVAAAERLRQFRPGGEPEPPVTLPTARGNPTVSFNPISSPEINPVVHEHEDREALIARMFAEYGVRRAAE